MTSTHRLFGTAIGTATSLALEATLQRSLMGSANQAEAVQANMQKREPKFSDPE